MKIILGISAFYHDSAVAIIVDGRIIAAAQEERFTRKKNTAAFPEKALKYCLKEAKLSLHQIDAISFYDKPLLTFDRLLQSYYQMAPKGLPSFLKSMPIWSKDKLFLKRVIRKELKKVDPDFNGKIPLLFPEHHLSHAASAFYPSPFEESAILTIDGVGEWSTASIGHGKGKDIRLLQQMEFPHSLGLLYSAFTYYLGFRVNSGEYKVMGLASFGVRGSERVAKFKELILKEIVDVKEDGSIWLNHQYFQFIVGNTMTRDDAWHQLFGLPRREPESAINQAHQDLALAIQEVTEKIVLLMAKEAKRLTQSSSLCLAGGVALNVVANAKVLDSNLFDQIFVQPAAGDSGGALGAALAVHHLYAGNERASHQPDSMQSSHLGPSFSEEEIATAIKQEKLIFRQFESEDEMLESTTEQLVQGKVIGWFQGRMEYGPRALGARSILADPRLPEMQGRVNQVIKKREGFRPFAPSVLEERSAEFFELDHRSPYMSFVAKVKQPALIPAVTHVDGSARVQTVNRELLPLYHALISGFEERTGCPMLLNTSFNLRGEPIVCSPQDAIRCFLNCEMDVLVMGRFMVLKVEQGLTPQGQ